MRPLFTFTLIYYLALAPPANAQAETTLLQINVDQLITNALSLNQYDRQTEIDEIKDLYKLSPWHFAPGISYDFIRNRYYLTISTSGLVSHYLGKRMETKRISAIERKYKARDLSDELKIKNRVLAIQSDIKDLKLAKKVVQIEIDIFLIQQEQFSKNEIDTEKFLNSKKNIINTIKNHNSSVTALCKDILELSAICNTPISADLALSDYYFLLDFLNE